MACPHCPLGTPGAKWFLVSAYQKHHSKKHASLPFCLPAPTAEEKQEAAATVTSAVAALVEDPNMPALEGESGDTGHPEGEEDYE